jgi:DNA modification methylase
MKLSQLKLNPKNPRTIKDERFKKLVKSLQEFPEMMAKRPMVCVTDVDGRLFPLGGNMRLKALQEIGMKEIPDEWVMLADDWTEEKRQEFVIKDNVGFGEWDWNELQSDWDLEQLEDWGLEVPSFETDEVLEAVEDDFDATPLEEAKTVLGDLYEIGEHRLLCGDSTDSDAVARLMNGQTAELLFTSPPYSDMREYNGDKDLSIDNLIEFIPTFYPYVSYQVINLGLQRKDNEIIQYWDSYVEKAKKCGYKLLSWNVWDKTIGGSIASATAMFLMTHEWIFVFGNKPKDLNRTIANQIDKYEARHGKNWDKGLIGKSIRGNDDKMKLTSSKTYTNHQLHTVIQQTPELGPIRKDHPATFPIGLPSEYIKAMTNEGDIVCESFTGSGSTMVASHQLKRKCYAMELDPKYCDVIVKRMITLDPTLTIKRNGIDVTSDWKQTAN